MENRLIVSWFLIFSFIDPTIICIFFLQLGFSLQEKRGFEFCLIKIVSKGRPSVYIGINRGEQEELWQTIPSLDGWLCVNS